MHGKAAVDGVSEVGLPGAGAGHPEDARRAGQRRWTRATVALPAGDVASSVGRTVIRTVPLAVLVPVARGNGSRDAGDGADLCQDGRHLVGGGDHAQRGEHAAGDAAVGRVVSAGAGRAGLAIAVDCGSPRCSWVTGAASKARAATPAAAVTHRWRTTMPPTAVQIRLGVLSRRSPHRGQSSAARWCRAGPAGASR